MRKKERDNRLQAAKHGQEIYPMSDYYPPDSEWLKEPDGFYTLCMQMADYDYIAFDKLMSEEDILDLFRFNMHKMTLQYH